MSARFEDRYAPDPMGGRLALKLERLSDWHALAVSCSNCGHAGIITVPMLRGYYPRHVSIEDMEHRFACQRCRVRGHVTWSVVKQRR